MNHVEQQLLSIAGVFKSFKHEWALVGGLAVSVRTEPRFTRDVDIVVAVPDDSTAERLVRELGIQGYRPHTLVEQKAVQRLATVRLLPPAPGPGGLMLDLLFASSGIEQEICSVAEILEVFPGVSVPVSRLFHLITLKALARDDKNRPQDLADLRQLITFAEPSDLDAAMKAATLVQTRGYNRERNLVVEIQSLWRTYRERPPS